MGAGLLYLFAQKAFHLPPRFGLDDGETGLESWIPQGFGTAKRGREAATAPKADNANHVAGL
jgi:hypothetical protein